MSGRKAQVKRTAKHQTASKQLQTVKEGIANAVKQLRDMDDDLGEIGSFVFASIQALRTQGGDDARADIATVLGAAYDKLMLDVNRNVRDALKALGQDDGRHHDIIRQRSKVRQRTGMVERIGVKDVPHWNPVTGSPPWMSNRFTPMSWRPEPTRT